MAINFLDNIQLNQNQLLGARLENVTSDPSTANGGDIIFNSTTKKLKYYDGTTPFNASGWISLPDGVGIGGSGTVGTVPVFVTNTTTLGDSRLETTGSGASQTFTFNTNGQTSFKGNVAFDSGLIDINGSTGVNGYVLFSNGTQVEWGNAPVSYTKWLLGPSGNTVDVNDGDNVRLRESSTNPGVLPVTPATKSGTAITQDIGIFTKNISLSSPGNYSTDVLLWSPDTSATNWKVNKTKFTDVTISTWADAEADISMDGFKITSLGTPTAGTDAANKTYVDNAIVGGFNVKGGFNANTGVTAVAGTNLYTNTAVAVGDYYVVTVAGNFFGNAATPLTPGDSVLAQTAAASGSASESNFAVIQSDTDIASASQIGIGNVQADTQANGKLLAVNYTNGTAVTGLNLKGGTLLPQAVGKSDRIPIWDGTSGNQGNYVVEVNDLVNGVQSLTSIRLASTNQTTHTFTHNLNTAYVMVQLFDSSTLETVYATVERTSANVVTATTSTSQSLTALIQKIG